MFGEGLASSWGRVQQVWGAGGEEKAGEKMWSSSTSPCSKPGTCRVFFAFKGQHIERYRRFMNITLCQIMVV
ncbi:hypothetical protein Taro_003325 [Colocasia esculenta]|uniref:Uncharacterized protein n=1 Tax=Colocasia esculenta TaxID=4460 RepID=A0A843TGQ9_COLES|nr:hypothetical protein [Colocasia esculenta]